MNLVPYGTEQCVLERVRSVETGLAIVKRVPGRSPGVTPDAYEKVVHSSTTLRATRTSFGETLAEWALRHDN